MGLIYALSCGGIQELAERRKRPTDRRLIAERTAKNLRMLATPLRIYHDRSVGRSMLTGTGRVERDYLTAPPEEMDMDEDDDEFESMLDGAASAIEGARVNTELYDAYGSHTPSWAQPSALTLTRRPHSSYTAGVTSPGSGDTEPLIPPLHSPPTTNRSGPWSLPPGATHSMSTGLSRQSSLRRPVRSRTSDFAEFSALRRSSTRTSAAQELFGPRSDEEIANSLMLPRHISPVRDQPASSRRGPQNPRRFFEFSRNRRHETTGSFPWLTESTGADANEESSAYIPAEPTPSGTWFSLHAPLSTSSSQTDPRDTEPSDERAQAAAPRLRRGGLRAPESMLSRHASPASAEHDVHSTAPLPVTIPPVPTSPRSDNCQADEAAATYPTPTSSENGNQSSTGS